MQAMVWLDQCQECATHKASGLDTLQGVMVSGEVDFQYQPLLSKMRVTASIYATAV
jgi:hypothetical protein